MKITAIGHGNVGGALIKAWAKAGHQITIGARNPEGDKVRKIINQSDNIRATSIEESIKEAEVIVISIPSHLTADLAHQLGNLSGKVIIDTTNSVFRKPEPYRTAFEAFQKVCKADVVKCFNSTGFENMIDPHYPQDNSDNAVLKADMFAAGSNPKAKEIALQLAKDAGFIAYDFGGDEEVELLEELCRIWINLAMKQGMGRNIAFKLLKR